jgi:hypothetical protein
MAGRGLALIGSEDAPSRNSEKTPVAASDDARRDVYQPSS